MTQFLLILIVIAYISQILFLLYGTRKKDIPRATDFEPLVSIVIAAKNEAGSLPACLASLSQIDYPQNKLEIIIADDCSTDDTAQIVKTFQKKNRRIKYFLVNNTKSEIVGKANAIALAVSRSKGEIVLLTDADCTVPAQWIKEYVAHFTAETGLVSGITCLKIKQSLWSVLDKVQSLDWIYLLSIGVSAARNGFPLSCVGNNFGFRREVSDAVGGYPRLGFTVTEDFSLLKAIAEKTNWKVRFSFNQNLIVESWPVSNIIQLFHQRKRWATGSTQVRFYGKLLLLIGGVAHIMLPLILVFHPVKYIGIAALGFSLLADFIFLYRVTGLLSYRKLLSYFLLFEIYYYLYTSLLAIALLFSKKVFWKGVVYDIKTGKTICTKMQ